MFWDKQQHTTRLITHLSDSGIIGLADQRVRVREGVGFKLEKHILTSSLAVILNVFLLPKIRVGPQGGGSNIHIGIYT